MQFESLEKLLYMYLYQVLTFHKTDVPKISFFLLGGGGGGHHKFVATCITLKVEQTSLKSC